ncbi:MAG: hypothetical protein JST59_02865 [Actinobacteria bacterium]|nr:hypothetical protein [Actinomycetota bacterium]
MKKEGYMPTKFTEMITYLVYLSKREDLINKINARDASGENKVESVKGLLKLRELADNNKEVNAERAKLKSNLKARFNHLWSQTTTSMNIPDLQRTPELLAKIREACRHRREDMHSRRTQTMASPRTSKTRL